MGKHAKAAELHREVLDVKTRVLGAEHPNTLASKSTLAVALSEMGKYSEAAELCRELLGVATSASFY